MSREFLHGVLVEEQDPAADIINEHNLPVNPLSAIFLHIKPLNDTGTLGNYAGTEGLLAAFNSIDVIWRGVTIFSARGADAFQLLLNRWHRTITQNNMVDTDDDRRSLVLPILFGRFLGDPLEGLPRSREGELKIRLDIDVADTGYDDLRYSIETLELPGASFRHFTRVTTISQTFAATGNNDVVLPVGHDIRGILLFQTTVYAGATPTPGLGRISILRDSREVGYSSSDVEVARAISPAAGAPHPRYDDHTHRVTDAGASDVNAESPEGFDARFDAYIYLDFDFTRDDEYVLNTRGANRLVLRSNAEVAESMRILPVEKVDVSTLA